MVRLSRFAEAVKTGTLDPTKLAFDNKYRPRTPFKEAIPMPTPPPVSHFPKPPPRKKQIRPTEDLKRLQEYQEAGVTDLGLKIPLILGPFGVHTIGVSATPEEIFEGKPPSFTGFELFQPQPPKEGAIDILATPPPFLGDIVSGKDVDPEFFAEKRTEYFETIKEKYTEIGIPTIVMPQLPDIFGPLANLGKYALIGGAILLGAILFMRK